MFPVNAASDFQPLYNAQKQAKEVMQTRWFPCYRKDYKLQQTGIYKAYLVIYSAIYEPTDYVVGKIQTFSIFVFKMVGTVFYPVCWIAGKVVNPIYPVNPVNGARHFTLVPRRVEKFLGDYIFYPLATWGERETKLRFQEGGQSIQQIATDTMKELVSANEALLNPENTTPFEYRVLTVSSYQWNAFACPGGGMVLYSGLATEIHETLATTSVLESIVTLADGSKVTVDLGDINTRDVLAVLMGHEMTHVASRHGIVAIVQRVAFYIFIQLCRLALWINKREEKSSGNSTKTEASYRFLDKCLEWVADKCNEPLALLNSRNNEYEADVTGVYMASKAGRNPLAALFLQDLLMRGRNRCSDFFHRNFEFTYTHPYGENRKRAILAAIQSFAPEVLQGKAHLEKANHGYDLERSGPAMGLALKFQSA